MSSWKARDGGRKTGSLYCDFKDNSGTFNSRSVNIPGIGEILPFKNQDEDTRTTEVLGLIKLAVNHWRVTRKRVLPVSTLHEWREANHIIRQNLPSCPNQESNENESELFQLLSPSSVAFAGFLPYMGNG